MGGILRNKKGKLLAAGGVEDHVHVYTSLPATLSIAQAAGALKANSSRWIHETFTKSQSFHWQDGYGAFTVSKSNEQAVIRYINNQQEHHRRRTFQEEFRELLNKHSIHYEERYLWV
jgi:REP element-mobilizing transposase RayT